MWLWSFFIQHGKLWSLAFRDAQFVSLCYHPTVPSVNAILSFDVALLCAQNDRCDAPLVIHGQQGRSMGEDDILMLSLQSFDDGSSDTAHSAGNCNLDHVCQKE